jgi:hypothetical protein
LSKNCIVCGKPIRKKTNYVRFDKPRPYRAATTKIIMDREVEDMSEQEERPEGLRMVDSLGNITLYTANPPKTKAECQRFTNGTVLAVKRHWNERDVISEFSFWDGETYEDEFFDNGRCAQRQGYASARHGDRWTWPGLKQGG